MNRNSNIYSILYASIMVILVAGVLAGVSLLLKEKQQANIDAEKMQNILRAADVKVERTEAKALYNEMIKQAFIVNVNGEKISDDPQATFGVDMGKEIKKKAEERQLPVFVFQNKGETKFVIPVAGVGMWDKIWGFIALEKDLNTVAGATFDHASETPGLGAEIATEWFQKQFKGEQIFDEQGVFKSIALVKGGAAPDDKHGVDAISGGTVTSGKLTETLRKCLGDYEKFLKSQKTE